MLIKELPDFFDLWDRLICVPLHRLIEQISVSLHVNGDFTFRLNKTPASRDHPRIAADGNAYIGEHPHHPGCLSVGRDPREAEYKFFRAREAQDATATQQNQLYLLR